MKNLFSASVVIFALLSCGTDQSEMQLENVEYASSLKVNARSTVLANPENGYYTVNRYYNSILNKHYFGANTGPSGNGWAFEGSAFRLNELPEYKLQAVNVMFNPNNQDVILTDNTAEISSAQGQGYVVREAIGFALNPQIPGAVPVYRYYRPSRNGHFFTKNLAELGSGGNGWNYEGIAFYAK